MHDTVGRVATADPTNTTNLHNQLHIFLQQNDWLRLLQSRNTCATEHGKGARLHKHMV